MADVKISELDQLTAPVADDILPIVDDPAGVPETKYITAQDLLGVPHEFGAKTSNTETLTGNKTLVDTDPEVHYLDPGGAGRNVVLPAVGEDNHSYLIVNTADAAENLTVKDAGAVVICVIGQGEARMLVSDGSRWKCAEKRLAAIEVVIGNGVDVITTGVKGFVEVPKACAIVAWRVVGDASGSIVIDVWKDTYANFPPTVADTITAAAKPTLAAAQKAEDVTLTGWTTALNAGDWLGFNVDSAATVKQVTLSLRVLVD